MSDGTETGVLMSDNTPTPQGEPAGEPQGEPTSEQQKTFTQEEVDKLVGKTRTEERRKVSEKYADYDELKAAAEGKKTADERLAEFERKLAQSEANTLRLRIAGDYGISTKRGDDGEPSDADLFLTGTDEETLAAQAKRLSDRVAAQAKAETERKKKNPTVPKEGTSTKTGTTTEEDDREFARTFFGGSS
ncbi:scaffolding protein [Gordonia phage Squiddly]|nr:scaffolding protein [Gordonia phage Squiddly]